MCIRDRCTTVHPCCVVSSSCLLSRLHLSLSLPFLIPHTLTSPPLPPPLSMSSPSSVFDGALQFNGDLSEWDVGKVTNMGWSECTTVHPRVVFLMSPSSLSLFSISDPTLTLVSPPPPLSMSSPSSVFGQAHKFNGDLSAWDVGGVTTMNSSECTTVHPCVVFLMSPPSLSFPFLIPHSHSSLLLLLLSRCPLLSV